MKSHLPIQSIFIGVLMAIIVLLTSGTASSTETDTLSVGITVLPSRGSEEPTTTKNIEAAAITKSIEDIALQTYPWDEQKEYEGIFPPAAYDNGVYFAVRDSGERMLLRKRFNSNSVEKVLTLPRDDSLDKVIEGKKGEVNLHNLQTSHDGRYLLLETAMDFRNPQINRDLRALTLFVDKHYLINVEKGEWMEFLGGRNHHVDARFIHGTHKIVYAQELRDFDMEGNGKNAMGIYDCDDRKLNEIISMKWQSGIRFRDPSLINIASTNYLAFRVPSGIDGEQQLFGLVGLKGNSSIKLTDGEKYMIGKSMYTTADSKIIATDKALMTLSASGLQRVGNAHFSFHINVEIPPSQYIVGWNQEESRALYAENVQEIPTKNIKPGEPMTLAIKPGFPKVHSLTVYDRQGSIVGAHFENPRQRLDFIQWADNDRVVFYRPFDHKVRVLNIRNLSEDYVLLTNVNYNKIRRDGSNY